jgi:hypothetical protein
VGDRHSQPAAAAGRSRGTGDKTARIAWAVMLRQEKYQRTRPLGIAHLIRFDAQQTPRPA